MSVAATSGEISSTPSLNSVVQTSDLWFGEFMTTSGLAHHIHSSFEPDCDRSSDIKNYTLDSLELEANTTCHYRRVSKSHNQTDHLVDGGGKLYIHARGDALHVIEVFLKQDQ